MPTAVVMRRAFQLPSLLLLMVVVVGGGMVLATPVVLCWFGCCVGGVGDATHWDAVPLFLRDAWATC
jgi:hypothetical protein